MSSRGVLLSPDDDGLLVVNAPSFLRVNSFVDQDAKICRSANESPSFVNAQFSQAEPELPNEISAPYEVPQFPIEQIEKKLAIQRQLNVKALEDRKSLYEPSVVAEDNQDIILGEHDIYVPHFQRVSISGEDTSGVPLEDLERASKLLVDALQIRRRYMNLSHQNFSSTVARFLDPTKEERKHDDKQTIEGWSEIKKLEYVGKNTCQMKWLLKKVGSLQ